MGEVITRAKAKNKREEFVFRLAHAMSKDEDICQDLVVIGLQKLESLKKSGYLENKKEEYIKRAIRNSYIDYLRKVKKHNNIADYIYLPSKDYEKMQSIIEYKNLCYLFSETLPFKQKKIFFLLINGFSQRDISKLVGLTQNNIRVITHRLKYLAAEFKEEYEKDWTRYI